MKQLTIKGLKKYPNTAIKWEEKIYFGMSMENSIFHNKSLLEEVIQFLSDHSSSFTVLVGDYLHRYNEMIFHGLNEEDAIKVVLDKGLKLKSDFVNTMDTLALPVAYNFVHTEHLLTLPEFSDKFDRFISIYQTNTAFSTLIDQTVEIFLRRQYKVKLDIEQSKRLCNQYLFEELAMFEILAEQGYMVNIYPGNQLPVIKAICTGALKGVSAPLEQIQAVEIKFRPVP